MSNTCPVALTANLIRRPSVTPEEGGALELLAGLLGDAGFECTRVDRNGTPNLFARWGAKGAAKSFGFNGTRMWCRSGMWPTGPMIPLVRRLTGPTCMAAALVT